MCKQRWCNATADVGGIEDEVSGDFTGTTFSELMPLTDGRGPMIEHSAVKCKAHPEHDM